MTVLPKSIQRTLFFLLLAANLLYWLFAWRWLIHDLRTPWLLFVLPDASFPVSLIKAAALLIPTLLSSLWLAWRIRPLAGLMLLAMTLFLPACLSLQTSASILHHHGMNSYWLMQYELIIWALLWVLWLTIARFATRNINQHMPKQSITLLWHRSTNKKQRILPTLLAMALLLSVAGMLGSFLLRNPAPAQVMGSLIISHAVGAMIAMTFAPYASRTALLLSPLLLGSICYTRILILYQDPQTILAAIYQDLPTTRLSQALPIHYASMGVAGVVVGLILAEMLERAHPPIESPQPADAHAVQQEEVN